MTVVLMVLGIVLMRVAVWKWYMPWAWWMGLAGFLLGAAATVFLMIGPRGRS